MKNREIAAVFAEMADIMEILGEDPFRVGSYRKAARSVEDLAGAIEDVAAAGKLQEMPGIGKSTAEKIGQFLATGKVVQHQELLAKIPKKLPELLAVPGLGPKTVAKLWKEAGITSRQELEEAIEEQPDKLMELPGFGARKVRQIWESLAFLKSAGQRMRLGEAQAVADGLLAAVRGVKGVEEVQAAGSLRRGKETIGDIDLLCKAPPEDAPKIIEAFAGSPGVARVLAKGQTKGSVVLERGVQADLRVVGPESFGAALAYFTGSKEHNIRLRELAIKKGLKLNEYGLFKIRDATPFSAAENGVVSPILKGEKGGVSGEVQLKDVRTRIKEDLEWRGISAQELGIGREDAESLRNAMKGALGPTLSHSGTADDLQAVLEVIEDRLMLNYGPSDNLSQRWGHLPRLNREGPRSEDASRVTEVWGGEFIGKLGALKEAFNKCTAIFDDENGWGCAPDSPGLYAFRTKDKRRVVYVGIAWKRGVIKEIKTQIGSDEKGSSLVKQASEWLRSFSDLTSQPREIDNASLLCRATEVELYKAMGLAFVAPELREDKGEVEAAAADKLPRLLELSDIRGDLHMHTIASDGVNTIDEMVGACRDRGYQFLAICDHSKSQIQANGLDEKRLAEHAAVIRKAGRKYGDILVLAGVEVDIFKDGRLDFEADVLAELDFVTASPHTALKMGGAEATVRLIRAIENPHVHCIGHPTGRLINSRPGMEIDIDKVAQAAAANGVALEINANYLRLDLRDVHVRAAIAAGAKVLINTDAHATAELDMMRYGVITARRGWAEKKDVVNTMTAGELKKWLRE